PATEFALTFGTKILTIDGQVNADYQIRWIFINIMAKPKHLISLHSISHPKMSPDNRRSNMGVLRLESLAACYSAGNRAPRDCVRRSRQAWS
ncbi:hypothetical protein K9U33_19165, partial [Rhodoblastus acidophilus]|uniref:hypothetical protein n=1 Tax=Candidatus Rhodoblastus alkanivorans TaxID=2954117 RepID=UPI001FAB25DE